jgi:hypothetical protein
LFSCITIQWSLLDINICIELAFTCLNKIYILYHYIKGHMVTLKNGDLNPKDKNPRTHNQDWIQLKKAKTSWKEHDLVIVSTKEL